MSETKPFLPFHREVVDHELVPAELRESLVTHENIKQRELYYRVDCVRNAYASKGGPFGPKIVREELIVDYLVIKGIVYFVGLEDALLEYLRSNEERRERSISRSRVKIKTYPLDKLDRIAISFMVAKQVHPNNVPYGCSSGGIGALANGGILPSHDKASETFTSLNAAMEYAKHLHSLFSFKYYSLQG